MRCALLLSALLLTVSCGRPVDTVRVTEDLVWTGPSTAPSHASRSRRLITNNPTPWQAWAAREDVHRLRLCESGDRLHAVSPTGKYQGLYQTTASWGRGSREVQDFGAWRLWRKHGAQPWPTCGRHLR